MDSLKEIFDYYDYDKDGKIDCTSFKLIINLINIQIIDCIKEDYDYQDIINYIKKYGILKKSTSKVKLQKLLKKNYKEDLHFIVDEIFSVNKN